MVSPYMVKDVSWIRQSFAVPNSALDSSGDIVRRTFSTNQTKFTDTSLGGNFAINPPPQFTRSADLRPAKQRLAGSIGQGRWYSENIDDNSQLIFIRAGVPEFNSLTTFFTGFYNPGAGQLARTGRSTGVFYALGRAVGFAVTVMNWLPLAVHLLGIGYRFFLGKPSSKFYYLKPTMPLYWNAVQTIVNQIAVNRGIVPRLGGDTNSLGGSSVVVDANGEKVDLSQGYQWDDAARAAFNASSPDIFTEGGEINVYAMATRAMRLQHRMYQALEQAASESILSSGQDLTNAFTQVMSETYSDSPPDFQTYLAKWAGSVDSTGNQDSSISGTAYGQPTTPTSTTSVDATGSDASATTATQDPDSSVESLITSATADDGLKEFFNAELDDGSEFVCFRVNATGSVSESFSSSTAPSEIANKINSMSSSSRSTNFDLANGDLLGGPIGKLVGAVANAAVDVVRGVADQLQVSGLAALAGAAFVDIPEHWESSSSTYGKSMSYTINLVSPYGNPMSQMMNIHIPLACLLALALPLSTGKQSYTSPFLIEIYDKGRQQSRLAIVDSMSVTRGTGNLGFTNEGHVMGVDVSFTVKDLSSVLHMPIAQGISFSAAAAGAIAGGAMAGVAGAAGGFALGAIAAGSFDEDTIFTDYMAVLGGMGLSDQIYAWRKYKLNLTKMQANFSTWASWAHWASWAGNTPPGRLMSMVYKGVEH